MPDFEFEGGVVGTDWCQFGPAWWKSPKSEKKRAQAADKQTTTRQSLLQQCFCTIKGMFR